MEIYSIESKEFREYGRVLAHARDSEPTAELLKLLQQRPVTPQVVYTASDAEMEATAAADWVAREIFGGMEVQVGWCNGYNRQMNAMEYHKGSEVNLAGTDLILMLGREQDVEEDFTYDTSKAVGFLVPQGTLIEVYATTLHYAPCHVSAEGFQSLVVLPRGTNTDLTVEVSRTGESRLITATNKWLIGHPDADLPQGTFLGLKGDNVTLPD